MGTQLLYNQTSIPPSVHVSAGESIRDWRSFVEAGFNPYPDSLIHCSDMHALVKAYFPVFDYSAKQIHDSLLA